MERSWKAIIEGNLLQVNKTGILDKATGCLQCI